MRNLFFGKYWTNTLDRDFERMKILGRDPGRILERCDLGLLDLLPRIDKNITYSRSHREIIHYNLPYR
jgi:hypothetical protein